MTILQFIADNFVMFFELIGLLIILRISVHVSARKKQMTITVVILLLAETACFHLEQWTQTFPELSLWRPLLTACVYSLYPIILLFLMQIIANTLPRRQFLLLLIPEFLCIPVYFTSQWTRLVCYFSEDNHYTGGPLSRLPYAIFGFYLLMFVIYNFLYFKNYSVVNRVVLSYIVVMSGVGMLFFVLFREDEDYCALFTSALLLYYILIYIHISKIDPLTRLLNRQSYYEDQKDGAKAITGVISADMNDLKYYNDTFGHEGGDTALVAIANILRTRCGPGGTVYRIGGDEFVIFYTRTGEAAITAAIADMREALAQTPYKCAFGFALKTPEMSMREVLAEADRNMYADKATMKKLTRTEEAPEVL